MRLVIDKTTTQRDIMPIDPDDDFIFDPKMNDFENEVDDDHEMIFLHNEEVSLEDLMGQGLDALIQKEAPTHMVNLILQQQHKNLLEGQLTKENDYQDWI